MSHERNRKKMTRLGHLSVSDIRSIATRDDYSCWYTRIKLTPSAASLDHRVAVSNGGGNSIQNLCVTHFVVNRAKGTLNASQFIHLCHLVAASHEDTGDKSWVPDKTGE